MSGADGESRLLGTQDREAVSWADVIAAWNAFLLKIANARNSIGVTATSAWFRGVSQSNDIFTGNGGARERYKLLPSLLRARYGGEDRRLKEIDRALELAEEKFKTTRKGLINQGHALIQTESMGQSDVVDRHIRVIDSKLKKLAATYDAYKEEKRSRRLLVGGEREAYHDYKLRAGTSFRSSWETLAEMRHHGVPTRLLDFSEVLAVALYFALRRYRQAIEDIWIELGKRGDDAGAATREVDSEKFKRRGYITWLESQTIEIPKIPEIAGIWILNPYRAAEISSKRRRIWDPSMDLEMDYYKAFVAEMRWPYELAIPVSVPWNHPRMIAQRGVYMLFGHSRAELEIQFDDTVLRLVQVPPEAAVYGLRHLAEFVALDDFSLYRDLDTLGKKVASDFLGRS